jgi:DNA polymerase III subunit delta'
MSWHQLEGHDEIVVQFRRALAENRLASTFLFVGPEGIGKRAFALRLAQALLCEARDEKLLDPCGRCPACVQVLAGTHPDLIQISRPPGKNDIPVGMLKGDDDYPVEQSLLFNLALKPFYGGRKVAIVDDADDLNPAGANCLLKTLEEPPPRSVLILLSTSVDRQLPTIRSRAQIVRFKPLAPEIVARLLVQQKLVSDPQAAARLAAQSGGSLTRAAKLADPQLWQFRGELLQQLSQSHLPSIWLAQAVLKFADEAGKEASARRDRLRLVVGFAAEFFRQLMRQLAGLGTNADPEMSAAVGRAVVAGGWDVESAAEAAQRSLEALAHIDRNANLNTLVEAWLDDLLLLNRRLLV